MVRNKDVLSAAHMFAIGIIVVLSLSIFTYPIGFLASADILSSSTAAGSLASASTVSPASNNTALNTGVDDGTGSAQTDVDSSSNLAPSSSTDPSPPPDSSTDSTGSTSTSDSSSESSGEGSTTTFDSSGGNPTGPTGSTGNDSSTAPDLGTSSSDSSPPPDSSIDSTGSTSTSDSGSSGEGSTTTSDSSGGSPTDTTGATGNDSSTIGATEASTPIDNGGLAENQSSSSISESSPASAAPDGGVSNQSSLSPTQTDATQTPGSGATSLSTSASTEAAISSSSEDQNAVTQPISAGDGQTVSLGDVSNTDGTSAKLSLDKQSYAPGDSAEVTVKDTDANVDPNVVNTIQIVVGASKDDPTGTPLTLTETAADSGEFTGKFIVASDPSKNHIFYDTGHPRAKAVIDGVSQPGAVEVKELPVSSFQTSLGEGPPDVMIGNGVQVSLTDGAELGPGGSMTVTLSYATAPADLNGQDASAFIIWEFTPDTGWVDIRDFGATPLVDENATTVTASSPLACNSECVFVIGLNTGGQGGGGGGAGLPGAGLILDLIAPLVDANSPPPTGATPPSEGTSASTTAPTAPVSSAGTQPSTSNNSNISATQESGTTAGGEVGQNTGSATVSSTGSTTITVPEAGNVTVSFTKLVSGGTLSVSAVKTPSELSALKIAKGGNGQGTLSSLDNTLYSIAGNVFVIGPLDSKFDGTATVTIPYNATLAPQASEVKVLHYTGSSWEDVTTNPPADGHVVTGSLSTLGPVVAAVKSQ